MRLFPGKSSAFSVGVLCSANRRASSQVGGSKQSGAGCALRASLRGLGLTSCSNLGVSIGSVNEKMMPQ